MEWWETRRAAWGLIVIGVGGGGVVTYLSPPIGIPVCLLLLGFGVWLLIRAYRYRDTVTTKAKVEERLNSKYFTDILVEMHKCTLELKDKALKQYKTLFTSQDFMEFLNMFASAMPEHQNLLENVKKGTKGKKLGKDIIRQRQQIDNLWDKLSPILKREMTLNDILAVGHLLERLPNTQNAKYKGIMALRKKNRRWNKLYGELNHTKIEFADIFANEALEKMVDDYLGYSFGGSSVHLFVELLNWFVPVLLPSEYIKSGAYDPKVIIENRMTKLLEDITNKIRELEVESDKKSLTTNRSQSKGKIGGLIGYAGRGAKVRNSHFKGKITIKGTPEEVNVGGLIGQAEENTEVVDSSADAEIEYKQD